MSIKDITIIITSFKSENSIRECLKYINQECKVINIENSNNEDYKKNIEKDYKNVSCILTGENLGYAKANNIGLENTKTKYALILNPDSRLTNKTLDNFFVAIKKKPDFAMIGPGEINFDSNEENIFTNDLKSVKNIKGYAMFLNLKEFENIGYFDENFFIYLEEMDLCKRLIKNGKKIYIDPSIKISHEGGKSHDPSFNFEMELSRNWHWMWSQFYFQKKYNGYFYSLMRIVPRLFSSLFKIILYSLLFNKDKLLVYFYRISGIINAILGKSSWYRPKIKN